MRTMCCFFFFKQKTAYEVRISDGSSDVCSSDLGKHRARRNEKGLGDKAVEGEHRQDQPGRALQLGNDPAVPGSAPFHPCPGSASIITTESAQGWSSVSRRCITAPWSSEEPTSDLQSLMPIPNAVFVVNKTKTQSN